ncbi:MAG: 50S ribosomal protein L6 [Chlamydiae bacterium]|nr:50S ribosomal protein L6 [Chlamydiota bacterium]
MARYGKKAILIPKGVEVKIVGGTATVKGPKGTLSLPLKKGVQVRIDGEKAFVELEKDSAFPDSEHGLVRSLIQNMVIGVSKGFEKRLSLVGVGYRAALSGHSLDLQLGFSHPTRVAIPKTVKVEVDKSVTIIISGMDKQAVGQFAATVRGVRPPEPYKGKGIRYEEEYVRKKAGKAAKGKTATA